MDLKDTIINLFNEEKWTRLTVSDYTINNFKSLDGYINQILEAKIENEIIDLCNEYLKEFKNNITALYFSGIIKLNSHSIDDSNLLNLINLFSENKRGSIVIHLAQRILDFGENRSALQILADCYAKDGSQSSLISIYERLVRVDYEEADIVSKLAEHNENNGNMEDAIAYYKKALYRYINKKSIISVQEIWTHLLELIPEETEFFYHVENRVSKIMDGTQAMDLLEIQYPYFKNKNDWNTAIAILKRILIYERKNAWARKELVACYSQKYAQHSNLEEYLKLSNISQSWRNIHDAIQDFEKHIAFDTGNFVYHRSWGVGKILKISNDTIKIHFTKNENHSMSLKMAVSSLHILDKNHIWVLRLTKKRETLRQKVKNDPIWALKTIIRSFSNSADFKKIKTELVPHILSASEWTAWGTRARKILKTDESFGNEPNAPDVYVVRDQPMNIEEKFHNRFKAAKNFFEKVKTLQDYLEFSLDEEHYGDNDLFREIYEYFLAFIRSSTAISINEQTVSAMLIVAELTQRFSFLHVDIQLNVKDFLSSIKHYDDIFQAINNADLRKVYLRYIRRYLDAWPEIYISILPYHLQKDIIRELNTTKYISYLVDKFQETYQSYRERRESYIWFIRNCREDEWFKSIQISTEKILISMIHLLELSSRDVENKREPLLNKKLNKQIHQFLIKDNEIESYINSAGIDEVGRIYSLLADVKDIDPKTMVSFRSIISNRFPQFEFVDSAPESVETVSRSGFLSLLKSYEERQRALKHLHEVEVPQNSKEIAIAREFGDLKENAEYKAAKERQDILNNTARKWESELQSVTVISPEDISTDKVGFGTEVTLLNLKSNKEEKLTIMGPWESNPEKKILSHLSPFAVQILNTTIGQQLNFSINQRDYNYKVLTIERADLDRIQPIPVSV